MRLPALRAYFATPMRHRRAFITSLGRLAVFLFFVEVVTGALLSLYFRPDPEAAFASVRLISNAVTFGWHGLSRRMP